MNFVIFCLTGLALLFIALASLAVVILRKLRSIERCLSLHSSTLNLLLGRRVEDAREAHRPEGEAAAAGHPAAMESRFALWGV